MNRISMSLALVLAAACGGSSTSAGSVSGNLHGSAFAVADAISQTSVYRSGTSETEAVILLSPSSGLCDDTTQNKTPKNFVGILLTAVDIDGAGKHSAPTVPGTYAIAATESAHEAGVIYFHEDATCKVVDADSEASVSGSVTITSIANGVYSGTFDATLTNSAGTLSEHITGRFAPGACPSLSNNNTTPATCF
jgi:hypothetical protein